MWGYGNAQGRPNNCTELRERERKRGRGRETEKESERAPKSAKLLKTKAPKGFIGAKP